MGLFGKTKAPDPKESVQKWTSAIRKESYKLDRNINTIKREEQKVTRSLKDAAKKGQTDVCKVLAKEVVNSRKAQGKLFAAKAHMNSVQMQMKNQLAVLRISGALESSTEVMQSMQQLLNVQDIGATMRELSQEMMKAGVIEEMVEDTLEDALGDDDELDEDVQEEVDKVLSELTAGQIGKAPPVHTGSLPVPQTPDVPESDEEEEDMNDMRERLQALRS
ncbi:charged multivesicular body protein 3-like [Watersipora subatra]|uniref:charged multivesicular body protein 3-like n=1 Tax=Watersipora subatra TaxID=2589382 RepID=UPI00355AD058